MVVYDIPEYVHISLVNQQKTHIMKKKTNLFLSGKEFQEYVLSFLNYNIVGQEKQQNQTRKHLNILNISKIGYRTM